MVRVELKYYSKYSASGKAVQPKTEESLLASSRRYVRETIIMFVVIVITVQLNHSSVKVAISDGQTVQLNTERLQQALLSSPETVAQKCVIILLDTVSILIPV